MTDDAPYALVVDDDAMILLAACDILEEAGFRALQACNVADAVAELERHEGEITLLFTDVQMPGDRNGFDLAVETSERWPDVKILVASGNMRPTEGQLPAGAIFITKPFSAEVVHGRLHELLPEGQKPEPLKRKVAAS